jgi:hypothetical protein
MRVTPGGTRGIQGVCQGVSSAKTFCMSKQIWAVRSVAGVGQYGLEDLGNAEFVVDHQDERHANPHCDARWLAP